jgi:hypothetical protein
MAVHKALCNLKLPKTAEVGFQRTKSPDVAAPIAIETSSSIQNDAMIEETGIQGLLWRNRSSKGKPSSQAYDFELKDTDAEHGDQLSIKNFIPVVITINLVRTVVLKSAPWPLREIRKLSYVQSFSISDRSKDVS